MTYEEVYAASIADPAVFWMAAADAIDWDTPPTRAADPQDDGMWRWFPDGVLNTCHNALDRHVAAGRGDRTALIHDSAMTGTVRRFTYRELRDEVALVAGMIAAAGVGRGDRVVIYMPMVPEAVFAMLACARLGAVHSVVFGGFAAAELAKRIDDAEPALVLTASCGLEPSRVVAYKPLLDTALDLARHRVPQTIVLRRPDLAASLKEGRDLDWAAARAAACPTACVPVAAGDPLYILYTSGTTGIAKGVVHDNGGHAVAMAWSVPNIYGVGREETFWAASDIGWAVGHSYIVYGPLIHGCTTVMYEGKPVGTPDAGAFWRVIRDHDVDVFFTAPTAIRAIKRDDPDGRLLVKGGGAGRLRALFLAGERADPDTLAWAEAMLGVPVIDHWWQTELGWPGLGTCLGLGDGRTRHGSAGHPVPGYGFVVLDEAHRPLPAGETGDIAIRLPLPPGCLPTLWRRHAHFQDAYLSQHPGHYTSSDAGLIDADGFIHVMSRVDDIINVAGHRLSTGAIEQIVAAHPAVAECAVVGVDDALKGMIPMGFVVLKAGAGGGGTVADEVVARVRDELGPVAAFKSVHVVGLLPKTRSGKILRSAIRAIANGAPCPMPPTIDDPAAIEGMKALFAAEHKSV